MPAPKVGILADDRLQQHHLRNALTRFGFEVVINSSPEQLDSHTDTTHIDVWVVDIQCDEEICLDWLDGLLAGETPVLLGIEKAPEKNSNYHAKWEKKLYTKLLTLEMELSNSESDALELTHEQTSNIAVAPLPQPFKAQSFDGKQARYVWVLGASLGGPSAIKAFFDALPYGLPVAFIYAQHIDPNFEPTLGKTIGRHSRYQFKTFEENTVLNYGEVLIAPIQNEFYFNEHYSLCNKQTPWPGPYGPSIDQVILNTYQAYGEHSGYIIFSGMGNDGAEALTSLSSANLPIWAQTPESCANSSMPESAINTGRTNFIGTPEQMAAQLVNHLKLHWKQAL